MLFLKWQSITYITILLILHHHTSHLLYLLLMQSRLHYRLYRFIQRLLYLNIFSYKWLVYLFLLVIFILLERNSFTLFFLFELLSFWEGLFVYVVIGLGVYVLLVGLWMRMEFNVIASWLFVVIGDTQLGLFCTYTFTLQSFLNRTLNVNSLDIIPHKM